MSELLADKQSVYEILGPEGAVYPGHPVALAFLVMLAFPSYEAATHKTQPNDYCAALTSHAIPGAGSNVHGALDLLKRIRLAGVEGALAFGDEFWDYSTSETNFPSRKAPGQAQADALKDRFRALAATWAHAGQAALSA